MKSFKLILFLSMIYYVNLGQADGIKVCDLAFNAPLINKEFIQQIQIFYKDFIKILAQTNQNSEKIIENFKWMLQHQDPFELNTTNILTDGIYISPNEKLKFLSSTIKSQFPQSFKQIKNLALDEIRIYLHESKMDKEQIDQLVKESQTIAKTINTISVRDEDKLISSLIINPSGDEILTASHGSMSSNYPPPQLWDLKNNQLLASYGDYIQGGAKLYASDDKHTLAFHNTSRSIVLWDRKLNKAITTIYPDNSMDKFNDIQFIPKQDKILITKNRQVIIMDTVNPNQNSKVILTPQMSDIEGSINTAVSSDGEQLYIYGQVKSQSGKKSVLEIWDMPQQKLLQSIPIDAYYFNKIIPSPVGDSLFFISTHGENILKYMLNDQTQKIYSLETELSAISTTSISSDGKYLILSDQSNLVIVDTHNESILKQLKQSAEYIYTTAQFSADNKLIIAAVYRPLLKHNEIVKIILNDLIEN